jgi:general L-amino acid transport system permease protein
VAGLSAVPSTQWGGLPLTLLLAFCSLLLSLPLGVLLALGRRSQRRWVHIPCVSIIELVRGVPLVTLLFTGAFMLPAVFPSDWQPSLLVRASFALTLFSSAYLAEVVRSGLQTVPQEQIEAAQVLGLSSWAIQWQVVLPQAMRTVLPGLTGHTIGLLKDTSLVMVVSLHELTGSLSLSLGGDADWRPYYLEGYLFIAALYALMCLGLGWTGRQLEARWAWGSTKA